MTSEEYLKLYQKFIDGKCNAEEAKLLFGHEDSFQMVEVKEYSSDDDLKARIKTNILKEIRPKQSSFTKKWYGYAAAAAIAAVLGAVLIANQNELKNFNGTKMFAIQQQQSVDSLNASTPILTLADGSSIALNQKANKLLTKEVGAEIKMVGIGELAYNTALDATTAGNSLNKIYIPRGNTFKITLSDGTKVWLNAASSLSYPTAFTGNERVVFLTGEAYFDVAKNAKMPFKVKMNNTEVQVLGTQFNVSAYQEDNSIKTTLIEGSVKLAHLGAHQLLRPGQQAIVKVKSSDILLREVNTQQVLAWKNGYFLFKDNSIAEVMSQVARWYKLEVIYQGEIEGKHFGGIYDKSKKLEELLKGLELTGLVKFKIEEGNSAEERRVIVMD